MSSFVLAAIYLIFLLGFCSLRKKTKVAGSGTQQSSSSLWHRFSSKSCVNFCLAIANGVIRKRVTLFWTRGEILWLWRIYSIVCLSCSPLYTIKLFLVFFVPIIFCSFGLFGLFGLLMLNKLATINNNDNIYNWASRDVIRTKRSEAARLPTRARLVSRTKCFPVLLH